MGVLKCLKCGEEKPSLDFSIQYKNGQRHKRCKDCVADDYREWYASNGRGRSTDYSDIALVWVQNHRKERNVSQGVQRAIRRGDFKRALTCVLCGRNGHILAHHEDYDKPLELLWVCASCHKKIHLETV